MANRRTKLGTNRLSDIELRKKIAAENAAKKSPKPPPRKKAEVLAALAAKSPNDPPPDMVLVPTDPSPKKSPKASGVDRRHLSNQQSKMQEALDNLSIRDIAHCPESLHFHPMDLSKINWDRRLACKQDPALAMKTYFPNIFTLNWADFHLELIERVKTRIINGGNSAIALPRGTGKTAVCRGIIWWATAYGYRDFAFFIGSKEDKAIQTLDALKLYWRSPLVLQDFPEIAYPVYRLEGRQSGAQGQLYKTESTHITWGSMELVYPCMQFTEDDIETYRVHDPSCVKPLPPKINGEQRYIINSGGTVVRVAGIDGSIRGEAETHPLLLTQPRPNLVLLDDVQKDQGASSPATCAKLIRLIESAVASLSAPTVSQATLMPCTVIQEGDVSDTYLKKEEWSGIRYGLIKKWPLGISLDSIDEEIGGEPNLQGKLWNQYAEVRKESYRKHGNLKLANAFYTEHRAIMDAGFEPTWEDRYVQSSPDPDSNEISAVQSAFNWRFRDYQAYLSEGENLPRTVLTNSSVTLSAEQIAERVTNIPRGEISLQWTDAVSFIDVQNEMLFWGIFAFDRDFNGQFIDYGTFPEVNSRDFKKFQISNWKLLSRHLERSEGGLLGAKTTPMAPRENWKGQKDVNFEAKIYCALRDCVRMLLARELPNHTGSTIRIRAIGIDMKWGEASETIKRFIREQHNPNLMGYEGNAFPPTNMQIEEYQQTAGYAFENQMHPHVTEPKWIIKRSVKSAYQEPFIASDVNRWKTFLMRRLATPLGTPGAISLYGGNPFEHAMFSRHLAAEYPEEVKARGISKVMWKSRPGQEHDNDFLDIAVGCLCLASMCGASFKTAENMAINKRPSLRDAYNAKRGVK